MRETLDDPIAIKPTDRAELAQVPGITREPGAERFDRVLKRLEDVLATMPGGWEGP
jgi:hypothetical protein